MKRDRCRKIRKWLGPYFDGELSRSKKALVETHLEDCLSCRRELARFQRLGALIQQGVTAPEAEGDSVFEGMHRKIREEIRVPEGAGIRRSAGWSGLGERIWGIRGLVPSAVAMVMLAALIFTIYKPPAPVIKTTLANECIIESIESRSDTVMLFQTHGSKITVIWISGTTEPYRETVGLWIQSSV